MYYITSGLHFSVQFTCIPGLYEGLQHWQISNDLWIKAVFLCEESTLPLPHDYCNKGKVCTQAEWPIQPELIWVSIAWNDQKYCYFPPLDVMPINCKVIPQHFVRLPWNYGSTQSYSWQKNCESQVFYPRTQHNSQASNLDHLTQSPVHWQAGHHISHRILWY